MPTTRSYPRLNIYLPDPGIRANVKIAAAKNGVSVSEYCAEAIELRLAKDGRPSSRRRARRDLEKTAQALDDLRRRIGPIGVPASRLVAEGRRR